MGRATVARRRHGLLMWLSAVAAFITPFFVFAESAEACHHELRITKRVEGTRVPGDATFTIDIDPVSGRDGIQPFVLSDGETKTFSVPHGTYVVSEVSDPPADEVTFSPSDTIEVPGGVEGPIEVVVTNAYRGGSFTLLKDVVGDAHAIPAGQTYDFTITGPVDLGTVTLAHGESWASGTVPLGTYTITEIDPPPGHTIAPNPVVLTDDGQVVTVTATNPYYGGFMEVVKTETGDTRPGATYTFDVTGPVDFGFELPAGETYRSDLLPYGEYTITEEGGPDGHTIVPNPVVIGDGVETVRVEVTNPYRDFRGKLAIAKVETGDTAPGATHTFDVTGPIEFTIEVAAGDVWTSDWLPLGEYTVTERDAPAGHTIAPNPVVIDEDGETVTVTATNPYRDHHAKLAIQKVVTGPMTPDHRFTIRASGPVDFTIQINAGDTWTSGWLPLGEYTITEDDPLEGYTIVPNPVVLDEDGATVTVVVTNPWPAGRLAIRKVETGGAAPQGTYRFEVSGPDSFAIDVKAGTTWTSDWIELGTYTITEVAGPPGHTIEPNPVVLSEDGATVTVVVTNRYGNILPATGSSGSTALLSIAGVLVGVGAMMVLVSHVRRRRIVA